MKPWLLWAIVVVEFVSPVPLVLTLGAAYVLLVRPPWFLDLVRELYGCEPAGAPRPPGG